jgi:hypothetical protein
MMFNEGVKVKRMSSAVIFSLIMTVVALVGWGVASKLYFSWTPKEAVGVRDKLEEEVEMVASSSGVLQAIERRNSVIGSELTGKKLAEEKVKVLAWAATGKNRNGTGFVVPLAMGVDPYVSIFVVDEKNGRKFNWQTNELEEVAMGDMRAKLVTQSFAKTAPQIMIFVIEQDKLPGGNLNWGYVAVGAMSEHVYLLADELNVQTRYLASISEQGVRENLKLGEGQLPVGAMVLAEK